MKRIRTMWMVFGFGAVVAVAACDPESGAVECAQDRQCNLHPGGSCDAYADSGHAWCSYADAACDSGRRWGKFAGDELADVCVAASIADAGLDARVVDASDAAPDARVVDAGDVIDAAPPPDGGVLEPVAADFNGDGFSDIVIGAPGNDAGGLDAGRAYVYFGKASGGFAVTPNGTLTGAAAGDGFGTAVDSANDVNGDGFADIIVGAAGANEDAGRAYIYRGGPGNTFDGTADATLNGAAGGDFFGVSVAAAGDVNGDGLGDVIVGAYLNGAGGKHAGRAYVYFGATGTFNIVVDGTLTGAGGANHFGIAVASAGDVNGDGYADVIVGADQYPGGGLAVAGGAYVYFGGPGATLNATANGVLDGTAVGERFGRSVAGAGDVNGDGFSDVVVGAYVSDAGGTDSGRAYVFFGGPGTSFNTAADGVLTGVAASDNFGFAVSSGGDTNRDGYSDVVVGAKGNGDGGRAYLYLGGPSVTFNATADGTMTGAAIGDGLGGAVSAAGDVNGDGFADLIVGAKGNDAGGSEAGAAYVFLGGPDAFEDSAYATLSGAAASDGFGSSVALLHRTRDQDRFSSPTSDRRACLPRRRSDGCALGAGAT